MQSAEANNMLGNAEAKVEKQTVQETKLMKAVDRESLRIFVEVVSTGKTVSLVTPLSSSYD